VQACDAVQLAGDGAKNVRTGYLRQRWLQDAGLWARADDRAIADPLTHASRGPGPSSWFRSIARAPRRPESAVQRSAPPDNRTRRSASSDTWSSAKAEHLIFTWHAAAHPANAVMFWRAGAWCSEPASRCEGVPGCARRISGRQGVLCHIVTIQAVRTSPRNSLFLVNPFTIDTALRPQIAAKYSR